MEALIREARNSLEDLIAEYGEYDRAYDELELLRERKEYEKAEAQSKVCDEITTSIRKHLEPLKKIELYDIRKWEELFKMRDAIQKLYGTKI